MKTITLLVIATLLLLATVPAVFADAAKGQGVYMNFCAPCHASGVAGAPKVGDKATWDKRSATGTDALVKNAIQGYKGETGFMPAKGGNSALTDEEVSAAVHYMLEQSK